LSKHQQKEKLKEPNIRQAVASSAEDSDEEQGEEVKNKRKRSLEEQVVKAAPRTKRN